MNISMLLIVAILLPVMGDKFVSKEDRKRCWDARDFYGRCLDNNNDDATKCTNERIPYVRECPRTWVKHFDKQRGYNKYKALLESGYDPMADKKS